MKNWRSLLAIVAVAVTTKAAAQDPAEAYNLSNTTVQGTARSIGFGGALGSIGGDFSAISVNPAGLGVYRSSELSFTPSLKINSSSSVFQGETSNDNNARITINNFGIVLTEAPKGKRYERRSWKAVSFALGMNRIADFNHDYNYQGNNNTSSASLAFEADANHYPGNVSTPGTLAYTGYNAYLINIPLNNYYTAVPFAGGIRQTNAIQERGGISEYLMSLGGNYREKLLLGATIGIDNMNYTRSSNYTESILAGNTYNPQNFQSFTYNNQLNITGIGANLKIGAIYKITDFLRIGAALHTPTIYGMHEYTDYGIISKESGLTHSFSTANLLPVQAADYTFISPLKSVLSASVIIKKWGFITADYEYVDYSSMKYYYTTGYDSTRGLSYQQEANEMNQRIKGAYQSASNLRIGAEIKLTKYFMVRGGFGYYGNPYKAGYTSMERMDISAGVGFRSKNFFADLGMVNSSYKFSEQAYNDIDYAHVATANTGAASPVADVKYTMNNIALTLGVKF